METLPQLLTKHNYLKLLPLWRFWFVPFSVKLNLFTVILAALLINQFHVAGLFFYPLKTSENQRFSDVFKGYRKKLMAWNGLRTTGKWFIIVAVLINWKSNRKAIDFFALLFIFPVSKPINQIIFWFQKVLIANPATKALRFQRTWPSTWFLQRQSPGGVLWKRCS